MADRSGSDSSGDVEATVEGLAEVLIRVASGDYGARAPRDGTGDAMDVLAFMINATVEETGELVAAVRRERDELAQTQEQLVHAGKLAALGQLAGGVAHELNQPLTAIRTLVDLGRTRMRSGGEGLSLDDLALLADAAERMGRIVNSIRAFARQDAMRLRPTPADAPARDALRLMETSLRQEGIAIETDLGDEVPYIQADADRLQQVLVNLLANARDALRDTARRPPGTVRLQIRPSAGEVVYVVEDDGPGVPAEVRERVFDPFFTTKEVGAGTGLGLSVSYGIVQEHGGALECAESPEGGARFVVRIPRRSEPPR